MPLQMTLPYTLRPATDADQAWLRWLHHATLRQAIEDMWGWDEHLQDAWFDEKFTPENRWIVQADDHNIGLIAVSRRSSEYFLDNIQIAQSHQGLGIGTTLIRELQDRARSENVPVCLRVSGCVPAENGGRVFTVGCMTSDVLEDMSGRCVGPHMPRRTPAPLTICCMPDNGFCVAPRIHRRWSHHPVCL
jgi:GNAT superfamily N-acetyltransferase